MREQRTWNTGLSAAREDMPRKPLARRGADVSSPAGQVKEWMKAAPRSGTTPPPAGHRLRGGGSATIVSARFGAAKSSVSSKVRSAGARDGARRGACAGGSASARGGAMPPRHEAARELLIDDDYASRPGAPFEREALLQPTGPSVVRSQAVVTEQPRGLQEAELGRDRKARGRRLQPTHGCSQGRSWRVDKVVPYSCRRRSKSRPMRRVKTRPPGCRVVSLPDPGF